MLVIPNTVDDPLQLLALSHLFIASCATWSEHSRWQHCKFHTVSHFTAAVEGGENVSRPADRWRDRRQMVVSWVEQQVTDTCWLITVCQHWWCETIVHICLLMTMTSWTRYTYYPPSKGIILTLLSTIGQALNGTIGYDMTWCCLFDIKYGYGPNTAVLCEWLHNAGLVLCLGPVPFQPVWIINCF